jgi:hypothetical protein
VSSARKRRNRRGGPRATDFKESLQRLDREVGAIRSGLARKPEPPWRPPLLTGLALAALGALILMTVLIPAGFSTPAPDLSILGSAKIYLIDGRSGASFPPGSDSGITVTTNSDQDHNQVRYELDFPPKLSGLTFVLAMTGSAVLTDVHLPPGNFSTKYPACRSESTGGPARCQEIIGEVPPAGNGVATNTTSLCFGAENDHVSVTFAGTSTDLNTSLDWAHRVTSMPYLGDHEIEGTGFVTQTFGPTATLVTVQPCQLLTLSSRLEEPQTSVSPHLAQDSLMLWGPVENEAVIAVVSKERSANWQANFLLAAIGILGPFLVALTAAAFKSWHRR